MGSLWHQFHLNGPPFCVIYFVNIRGLYFTGGSVLRAGIPLLLLAQKLLVNSSFNQVLNKYSPTSFKRLKRYFNKNYLMRFSLTVILIFYFQGYLHNEIRKSIQSRFILANDGETIQLDEGPLRLMHFMEGKRILSSILGMIKLFFLFKNQTRKKGSEFPIVPM
jgi:hypothetical protein